MFYWEINVYVILWFLKINSTAMTIMKIDSKNMLGCILAMGFVLQGCNRNMEVGSNMMLDKKSNSSYEDEDGNSICKKPIDDVSHISRANKKIHKNVDHNHTKVKTQVNPNSELKLPNSTFTTSEGHTAKFTTHNGNVKALVAYNLPIGFSCEKELPLVCPKDYKICDMLSKLTPENSKYLLYLDKPNGKAIILGDRKLNGGMWWWLSGPSGVATVMMAEKAKEMFANNERAEREQEIQRANFERECSRRKHEKEMAEELQKSHDEYVGRLNESTRQHAEMRAAFQRAQQEQNESIRLAQKAREDLKRKLADLEKFKETCPADAELPNLSPDVIEKIRKEGNRLSKDLKEAEKAAEEAEDKLKEANHAAEIINLKLDNLAEKSKLLGGICIKLEGLRNDLRKPFHILSGVEDTMYEIGGMLY